ncbi:hypothetical protein KL918_004569 [Ogataea parapolymorpha]|uniref:AP-1 complex subunit mu-1 n=1 Tax=Ogataea parapolymorpha (strain ATCC 26012 / BCRC 20466 / JCM 22074 / NRRL Y-7560 / DL-1) TaxID=871575 RepID=W1QL77_OGAPD|nr:AP-1 complex subunit mu-1 [Ogataea parapolymorpha DL-1]ESX03526.1 AP-1 complex subunit mu-1 [Ogataea parapolymorpha DL-1]KAG7865327.1 hypothetical protein KL918_004569 [Ogataea parapolymorpha]KAG7873772.1 hypothetical protein KL916_001932 [Ogataea parapolymorpha]
MISAFFVYNGKGEVLISRLFRDGVRRNVCEVFRIQVISKCSDIKSPVLTLGSTSFLHIRHGALWIVAVTRSNVDASIVLEYLHRFVELLKRLFELDNVTEDDVKAHFPLVYEVLDESIESGHVSNLDLSTLRPYLSLQAAETGRFKNSTASGLLAKAGSIRRKSAGKLPQIINAPLDATAASHPWRPQALKYKKNLVQIDLIEDFNLLTTANGFVLRSFVEGRILMDCRLSGIPTCLLGLVHENQNDAYQEFKSSDCTFHQCVNLKDFDEHRIIKFIPPDGKFELLSYRTDVENPPFNVYTTREPYSGGSESSYTVDLESAYPSNVAATNVVVRIPVPPGTSKLRANTETGKCRLVEEENVVQWSLKKMNGGQKHRLQFAVPNTPADAVAAKPPISLSFSIDSYSVGGHKVKFFKVHEPTMNYATVKSVTYLSRAKSYEIRM